MDLFNRLQGIFFNPKVTLKAISEKPIWIDALIILLIAWALFNYITTPYLQKDTLQLLQSSDKLQERMGEDRFNEMIKRTKNPTKASVLLSNLLYKPGGLLVGFLFSSLIIFAISRMFSTEGNYKQVLAALLHANFIDKILGNALRLVLILTRKSFMQTTTSLALFFPKLEITSPTFIIL
ncbi:MAG: YIP1 family protein, partial [Deltaproteobacteria bacterium]|nr:YIP1 family protein [Deltaproteobacteria bacterium]